MDLDPGRRASQLYQHAQIARLAASRPRGIDGHDAAALAALVLVASTVPVAGLALALRIGAIAALAVIVLATAATVLMIQGVGRHWGRGLDRASSRWRTPTLRLIPARHQLATKPRSIVAATPAPRTRSSRSRRGKFRS